MKRRDINAPDAPAPVGAYTHTIEVKGGLQIGDSVIISDMSQFDATNRVRIK